MRFRIRGSERGQTSLTLSGYQKESIRRRMSIEPSQRPSKGSEVALSFVCAARGILGL
jgi:hypothetical protein